MIQLFSLEKSAAPCRRRWQQAISIHRYNAVRTINLLTTPCGAGCTAATLSAAQPRKTGLLAPQLLTAADELHHV
jgi:hypothetical protein